MTLFSIFSNITDPRRKQGLRTNLEQVLTMVVLSYLCGHTGYRGVARFCKHHSSSLKNELGLIHEIPSYVTFRDVLMRIDKSELIAAFNKWSKNNTGLSKGDWLSGDGKVLGSTVKNSHNSQHDFQSVVSFFSQESGLVYSLEQYQNKSKESGEMSVVRFLISQLKDMGIVIRLDALHTQKKQ